MFLLSRKLRHVYWQDIDKISTYAALLGRGRQRRSSSGAHGPAPRLASAVAFPGPAPPPGDAGDCPRSAGPRSGAHSATPL